MVLVVGRPASIGLVNISLLGDLAVKLSWLPPDDKGLGDFNNYFTFDYLAMKL